MTSREQFEYVILEWWNKNPSNGKFDLTPFMLNGKFKHYLDPDTDNAWIGFLLAKKLASTNDVNFI